MRDFRDTGQEISKSIEKTAGVPLNAKVYDNNFFVEDYLSGFSQPISMTFLGNDMLILEKNTGHVKLIRNNATNGAFAKKTTSQRIKERYKFEWSRFVKLYALLKLIIEPK